MGCGSSLKRMPTGMAGVDFWGGLFMMNTPPSINSAPRGGSVVAERVIGINVQISVFNQTFDA